MATWPTSIPTDANLYIAVNELQTNLSSGVNSAVTTLTLNSTTSFPTVGLVLIDNEIIKYTGVSGSDLTGCTRAFDGTTAASHSAGAVVSFAICANHHNVIKDEIIALATYLSNNLGTGAQPLSNGLRALASNGSGKIIESSVTSTELGYLSGVSSAIQTQLAGKEPTITTLTVAKGGTNSGTTLNNNRVMKSSSGAIVEATAITANRALASDANGIPVHTSVTDTELGYVSGVTSAIQTQLAALSSHVFQFVTATSAAQTDNTNAATYTDTGLAATITPSSSSHKILILVSGEVSHTVVGENVVVTVKRGSTNVVGGTAYLSIALFAGTASGRIPCSFVFLDSPATTSATTYTVAVRRTGGSGTASWNDGACQSQIVLVEVV